MRRLVPTVTAAVTAAVTAIVLTTGCGAGDSTESQPAQSASPPPAGVTLVAEDAAPGPRGPNLALPVDPAEAPVTFLAVRDQTRLVVADTATGQDQRVLFDLGPQVLDPEFERQIIMGLALSPDGKTAFFAAGKRPEPESRVIYRVAVDGGQPGQIGPGSWPAVSPDGRRLAFIDDETVVVQDLATGATRRLPLAPDDDSDPYTYRPGTVAWAVDSRHLVLASSWRDSLTVLDADTAAHQLDGRSIGAAPLSGEYWLSGVRATDGFVGALISLWKPETDVGQPSYTFVVLDPTTGAERERADLPFAAVDAVYDASGCYQLFLAEDGSVYRSGGDGFMRIPGAASLVAW